MAHSVLDRVSLGYQLIWSQLRQVRGVQLFIGTHDASPVNAVQLLAAINEQWTDQAPALLLSTISLQLLADLLSHASGTRLWIEVHDHQLRDPAMVRRVYQAHQRGLKLIWRGEPGARPRAALAPCFSRKMINLTPDEALAGLRVSLRKHNGADPSRSSRLTSPVQADQLYEGVASRVLAEHCLDEQGVWGVAGWPMEDVLHGYRHRVIPPGHRAVVGLIEAIDADEKMECVESMLSEEPTLAYRFMRYANSAGLGLPTAIDSLRHGLMALGLASLRSWLLGQLNHATSDLNLQPVRAAMVVRARLMEYLLEAGDSDDLRREVYLCGLLSQIDLMLGEPLNVALARIPFSERIISAVLGRTGPYLPYLDIATALESPFTHATQALCEANEMRLEEVNRALLRTLCTARPLPAKGTLL